VLNLEGRRMSKSLGTGLDPLDYIEEGYGADALRFALALRCSQGQQDLRFGEKMLEDVRHFNNKIWNAARFARMHLDDAPPPGAAAAYGPIDRWIRSRFARLVRAVTDALEAFEFDKAARALYEFIWGEYCDWYVEFAKVDLYRPAPDPARRAAIQRTLWQVLEGTMRLLHPIMPHITEEIWQLLPHDGESVVVAPWPTGEGFAVDEAAERQVETLMAVIRAIRSLRADLGLPPTASLSTTLHVTGRAAAALRGQEEYIATLARAAGLAVTSDAPRHAHSVGTTANGVGVSVLITEGDRPRARTRVQHELRTVRSGLARVRAHLADPDFATKAPPDVVAEERRREGDLAARERVLTGYLTMLG
jgi:valyl-tRNA synthetase